MHKYKKIIFRHGFGLSNDFWKNLLPFFQEYECILTEENYFNNKGKISPNYGDEVIEVAIGHSLGFWKLCQELSKVKYLIGINAFTNFLGEDKELRISRTLEHETFKIDFYRNPKNTLKSFYKRCGLEYIDIDFPYINIQNMANDLDILEKSTLIVKSEVLIINSMNDLIVPKKLTEDNFTDVKAQIHYLESGKHALGFYHAEEISKIIKDFII